MVKTAHQIEKDEETMKKLIATAVVASTILLGTQTTAQAQVTNNKKIVTQTKKAIKIIKKVKAKKQTKKQVSTKNPMQIAEDISKTYYIKKNGPVYAGLKFKFDHYEGDTIGVVWVYESHADHLATINWYTVDLKTKKVIEAMYEF